MIDKASYPMREPRVKTRKEKFGELLVAPGLPMLCLNPDGVAILNLCDGTRSVAEIIRLCGELAGADDSAKIEQQVIEFLSEASRLGLLQALSASISG